MRLPSWALRAMLGALFDRLAGGLITEATYVAEWDRLLGFAGWTEAELLSELDGLWSSGERREPAAFEC